MDLTLQKELLTGVALLAAVMIAGLVLHLALQLFKSKQEWIRHYFALDVLLLTLAVITSGRAITGAESILIGGAGSRHSVIVSQMLTLLLLGVAAERMLRIVLSNEMRHWRSLPLLGAMAVFYLAINFLTPLLGIFPEFQHNFLYAPLVSLALFAVAERDGHRSVLSVIRNAYAAFLGLGLAFLVLRPSMVADFTYAEGFLPGLHIRFFGFGTHPNSLAPYCLMLLFCLWVAPFRRPGLNRLAWGIGLLSLLLTQSKTTIGLGLVIFGVMWAMSRGEELRRTHGAAYRPVTMGGAAALAMIGSLAAIGGLVALMAGVIDVGQLEAEAKSDSVLTLTGRTFIWQLSLSRLWDNPLFGYGADLWGPAYQQHMQLFVAHAHNQYVHTLGDSGFVGLVALVIYCLALGIYSWRVRMQTRWLSVGLASYIFLRGITEAPLIVDSVFGAEFSAHMILLILCVGGMRARAMEEALDGGVRHGSLRMPFAATEPAAL